MTLVSYAVKNRVAYIGLQRPEKRNAFNRELVSQLREAFREAQCDTKVKVIILHAEGKVFSAGADLEYLQSLQHFSFEENLEDSIFLKELYWQIYHHPKVVIAAVQGHAMAGGCGLLTVCDFVFSVPDAQFAYTEVKIGFVPAIVAVFLIRKIGEANAKRLLLSADTTDAATMHRYGIVSQIVDNELLMEKCEAFAQQLCQNNSAQALQVTKQLIAEIQEKSLEDALQMAALVNARARGFEDCKKGIEHFLNKEKIVW